MDEQVDHSITVLALILTAIVFALDVITPLGIATWALYILPLEVTRWSPRRLLTTILAGVCTALIILAHFLCPSGSSPIEVDIFNRTFRCADGVDRSFLHTGEEYLGHICDPETDRSPLIEQRKRSAPSPSME